MFFLHYVPLFILNSLTPAAAHFCTGVTKQVARHRVLFSAMRKAKESNFILMQVTWFRATRPPLSIAPEFMVLVSLLSCIRVHVARPVATIIIRSFFMAEKHCLQYEYTRMTFIYMRLAGLIGSGTAAMAVGL